MLTSEFIKPIQESVLQHYGLELTNQRHRDCFICQGVKKLRINVYNGDIRGICTCGNYSLIDMLIELTGQDFASLAKDIDVTFGNTDREPIKPKDTNRRDQAIALFRSSAPLRGSDAEVYLQGRGIYELPTGGVKFGTVYDHTEGRRIPAMIALASTEFTEPRQMHVTYIENGKKADIATQRKMFSLAPATLRDKPSSEPIAIKLFTASNVLGIAEGIESALSAKQLYRIPTWAAMNATYLKRFRAPTGVTTLYIFSDNDSSLTGLAAAMSCGRANLLSSNDVVKVVIRWPETLSDFNNVLVEGDEVLEWIGSRSLPAVENK